MVNKVLPLNVGFAMVTCFGQWDRVDKEFIYVHLHSGTSAITKTLRQAHLLRYARQTPVAPDTPDKNSRQASPGRSADLASQHQKDP
jgi:hypothetical protein